MKQVAVGSQIWSYHYINGKGVPIIVMHGWGRSGSEWIEVANSLNQYCGRQIYLLDLPGFGGSSMPKSLKDIFEYAELVKRIIDYLGIKKFAILGHSLGGRVGIILASKYPGLVESLVLVNPAGIKPKSWRRVLLNTISSLVKWVPVVVRRRMVESFMDEDYRSSPTLRDLYRVVVGKDLRDYLARISCFTTVIWGEKDPILPLSLSKVYKESMRNCRVRVIWEAGHDPHLTHRRELVRILEEAWS